MQKKILLLLCVFCKNRVFCGGVFSKKKIVQGNRSTDSRVREDRSLESELEDVRSWSIWVEYSRIGREDTLITKNELKEARKNKERSESKSKLFLIEDLSDSER